MKALKLSQSPDNAIGSLLKYLFEQNKISAAFVLCKNNSRDYFYGLITDKNLLEKITPTTPIMPSSAGKMLSKLTMLEPLTSPIAVVLRPCEMRAFYELIKLEQARPDNILFISFTCKGVISIKESKDGFEEKIEAYQKNPATELTLPGLRQCCQICENFVPENADIILPLIEKNDLNNTTFLIKTEKAEDFVQGFEAETVEEELNDTEISKIKEKRARKKAEVFANITPDKLGMKGLIDIFGRCLNCHACGRACPICYCNLCYFDSADSEVGPKAYEAETETKGAYRLPANTIFYHIGRMIHISLSCIGCGMCTDVCPVSIPVGTIFTRVAESAQEVFKYIPGRNIEEKIPILTFKINEFEEIGEE